jgi:hypothetical protein
MAKADDDGAPRFVVVAFPDAHGFGLTRFPPRASFAAHPSPASHHGRREAIVKNVCDGDALTPDPSPEGRGE